MHGLLVARRFQFYRILSGLISPKFWKNQDFFDFFFEIFKGLNGFGMVMLKLVSNGPENGLKRAKWCFPELVMFLALSTVEIFGVVVEQLPVKSILIPNRWSLVNNWPIIFDPKMSNSELKYLLGIWIYNLSNRKWFFDTIPGTLFRFGQTWDNTKTMGSKWKGLGVSMKTAYFVCGIIFKDWIEKSSKKYEWMDW